MGRGRKPKPTTLKILQGNVGKRKLNRQEPDFGAGAPEKPAFFDDDASAEWDRLAAILTAARVITKGEMGVLVVACDAYSQLRQCERFLREKKSISYVVKTEAGDLYRPYPEIAQRNQARRQYLSALAELGLTPSSRSRVKQLPQVTPGGAREFLG